MPTERIDIVVSERGSRTVRRNISDIGKGAQRAQGSVTLLRRALGALGGALILTSAVQTLAAFSQEMSTVRAVTGATSAQFKELTASAKNLGATTRFTATQAAEGMTFLARAGFDTAQVLTSVGDVLTLAQAGGLDLGRAADIASNVLKGFNLEAEQTVRIVDVLAKTAASSNTTVEQLGDAMSFVAPAAAAVGASVENTSAAIGVLSDAGIQATRAGTGLRQIFVQLLKPSGAARKEMEGLGLNLSDVDVESRGLIPVLETLRDKQIGLSEAANLVGVRQASSLLVLTKNIPRLRELTKLNEDATGTAREMARVMDDNLNGSLLKVKSAFEAIILAIGQSGATGGLRSLFDGLANGMRFLADNIDRVIAALKILATAFLLLKLPAIIGGVARLTVALKGLALAALANPIVALGAAMTVTAVAMSSLRDEIKLTADGSVLLTDALEGMLPIIDDSLKGALTELGVEFSGFNGIVDRVLTNASKGFVVLLAVINGTIRASKVLLANFAPVLKNLAKQAFSGFVQVLEDTINKISELFNKFLVFIGKKPITTGKLVDLSGFKPEIVDDGVDLGLAFKEGFLQAIEGTKDAAAQRVFDKQLEEAKRASAAEKAASLAKSKAGVVQESAILGGSGGGGKVTAEFKAFLKSLERQNTLIGLNNSQLALEENLFQAVEAAGRPLTDQQEEMVVSLTLQNLRLTENQEIYNAIIGPQKLFEENTRKLNQALADGVINLEQHTKAARENRLALLETETTASAGAERFFIKLSTAAADSATQIEDLLGTAFRGVTDSLVEFVNTGKLSVNDLANEIQQKLLRGAIEGLLLSTAQAFGAPGADNSSGGLLGSLFGGSSGGGGGGGGGGIAGLIGSLFSSGAQNGADFRVSSANTSGSLAGTDNRLLTLPVKDGERVRVDPEGRGGGDGGVSIVINVNGGSGSAQDIGKAVSQAAAEAAVVLRQANARNN